MSRCSGNGGGCNGQVCALYVDATTPHDTAYNTYWADSGSTLVVRRNGANGYSRDEVAGGYEATALQADTSFVSGTDLRLQPGSPLVDAMPCSDASANDLFDTPRPQSGGCDIGAHEQ